jgi:hypothetical protein
MSATVSLNDAVVLPRRTRVWFDPTADNPERVVISFGGVCIACTEAEWRDLAAAVDAGFATLPAQRRQYEDTARMLGAASAAARKSVTA